MPKFNKPHLCFDWDFMLVVPGCHEIKHCTCGEDGILIQPGTLVKTKFYRDEANRVRTVKECFPAPVNSQSGFYIMTECGLSCDAGWFTEA